MARMTGSIQKTPNGPYRARYRDSSGHEHLKRFKLKSEARAWLDQETTKLQTGSWVAPRRGKITVREWCIDWLKNYATRKPSTVRSAQTHIDQIVAEFGVRRLDSIRPSEVKQWTVRLREEGWFPLVVANPEVKGFGCPGTHTTRCRLRSGAATLN
jgi:hypothetical protein